MSNWTKNEKIGKIIKEWNYNKIGRDTQED
jgi:hypothetical protein